MSEYSLRRESPSAPVDEMLFKELAAVISSTSVDPISMYCLLRERGVPRSLKTSDNWYNWRGWIAEEWLRSIFRQGHGPSLLESRLEFDDYKLVPDDFGRVYVFDSHRQIEELDAVVRLGINGSTTWAAFEMKSGNDTHMPFERRKRALSFLPGQFYQCKVRISDRLPILDAQEAFQRLIGINRTYPFEAATSFAMKHARDFPARPNYPTI